MERQGLKEYCNYYKTKIIHVKDKSSITKKASNYFKDQRRPPIRLAKSCFLGHAVYNRVLRNYKRINFKIQHVKNKFVNI